MRKTRVSVQLNTSDSFLFTKDKVNKALLLLNNQKLSIQEQLSYGILNYADAKIELEMISKKEFSMKEKLVKEVHRNKNGTEKAFCFHAPTKCYPNGYYQTKVNDNYKPKRATKEELILFLFDFYNLGIGKTTFENVWKLAIEERRKTKTITEATFQKDDGDFKRYLSDIKDKDIKDFTLSDMKEYTKSLVTLKNLTEKNYNAYKHVLNIIYEFALEKGYVKTNIPKLIDNAEYKKCCVVKSHSAEEKILSVKEISLVKEEISKRFHHKRYHGYYVYGYMMLLAIETGMRAGELCSLHWSDILENEIWIHTQQRLLRKPIRFVEVNWTKDEKGVSKGGRKFPITNNISKILSELKAIQIEKGILGKYVFVTEEGNWTNEMNYCNAVTSVCRKLNLSVTNNHAFRMALNSNVLIPLGIPVTERAKLLGHSVETNLKFYSFEQKDYIERTRNLLNMEHQNN